MGPVYFGLSEDLENSCDGANRPFSEGHRYLVWFDFLPLFISRKSSAVDTALVFLSGSSLFCGNYVIHPGIKIKVFLCTKLFLFVLGVLFYGLGFLFFVFLWGFFLVFSFWAIQGK